MSARDVLREATAKAAFAHEHDTLNWTWEQETDEGSRDYFRAEADLILDALRAHPVELLALLAEPKVCETCWGDGDLRRTDGYPPGLDEVGKPCVTCHGTGSVAVDVLDLLAEAGLLRMVGSGRAPDAGDAKCDEWELLPTVGPSERGWEPIYVTRGEQ